MNNAIQLNSALNPVVKIGDSCLSYSVKEGVFHLDTPDMEYSIVGFKFPYPLSMVEIMVMCLSFMAAAAEAQRTMDRGRFSDNSDIFEPEVMRWCQENDSEINIMIWELDG